MHHDVPPPQDSCGEWSFTRFRYWDYCSYPEESVAAFDAQSAADKQAYLWAKIAENKSGLEYPELLQIFTEDVQKSFDTSWDWMNEGRAKRIHGVGAVCAIHLEVSAAGYTGVLAPGVARGFIRMGSALDQFTSSTNNPVAGYHVSVTFRALGLWAKP